MLRNYRRPLSEHGKPLPYLADLAALKASKRSLAPSPGAVAHVPTVHRTTGRKRSARAVGFSYS